MSLINFYTEKNYAVIKLNRPEKYNSFTRPMAIELQEKLDYCNKSSNIRAIYFSGNGKAFCAGQDLKEVISNENIKIKTIVEEYYNPIVKLIQNISIPVVCGVNGVAAGAGANIALSCDITIAASSAKFIQAFINIGLIPDSGGTYFLPRLIGLQKAKALSFLGKPITSSQAKEIGMIYDSVEDSKLECIGLEITEKLSNLPTKSIEYTKILLNQSFDNSLEKQLKLESDYQEISANSYDFKEGIKAFVEKRKPKFLGK